VKQIRLFAADQPKPDNVFFLAQLPPPKSPAFGTPPGQPYGARATLDTVTGALSVSFKCDNPKGLSGTVYVVSRRNSDAQPWTTVAITSTKRFTDATIVAGSPSIQYQIIAQRGGITGQPSGPITVSFGRAGGGGGGGVVAATADANANNAGTISGTSNANTKPVKLAA
jgi:hypothetical protein